MRGDWYSPPLSPVVSSSNPFSFPASALRSCSFRLRDEHTHASSQGHHHTHTTPHHTAITCVSTNDNDPYRHQSAHGHDNSHSTDTNVNPNTLTDNNRDTCNTGDALHIQCNDVNASMNQRQGGMMTVDLNTNTKMNMKMNIMKMSIGSTDISDSPSNSPCFSPIPISPRHKKGSQQHQKNHTNTNKGSDVNNSNTNIEINNNIKNKINNNINNNDNHDHNCSHSLHSSPTGTFLQRTHIEMAPHIRTPLSPLALSPQCASPMDSPRTRNDGNIEPASTVRMKMNTGISYMSDSVHLSVSSRSNSMYTQESSRSGADEKKSQRERKRNVSVHDCDVNTTVHENADGQRHEAKTKLRSIAHQSNIDASLYSESHIHHQQQLQDRFQQAQHQHQQQQEQQEQQKQQAQVQEALQSLMDELHAVRAENEVLYEVKKENSVLTKKIKRLTAEARKASKLETQLKKTNSEQSDRIKNLVDFKEKYERSQVLVTQQTSTIRRLDKKQARLSAKSKSMNALQDRVHKQEYELKQVRGKLTTLQSKHDTLRGAGKGGKDLSKLSSGELAELMAIHSEGVVRVQGAIVEALNQEKQALEDSRLCVICCDRARDCVLDCLHFVTCFECASIINRCPCCRRPITERKEVYM